MKLNYGTIEEILPTIEAMEKCRFEDFDTAKKLYTLKKELNEELAFYHSQLGKLIEEYGKKDEDGNVVHEKNEDGTISYMLNNPVTYNEKLSELYMAESDGTTGLSSEDVDKLIEGLKASGYKFNGDDIQALESITER